MTLIVQALIVWAVVSVGMALVWLLQRRLGDAGIVDVAWSYAVGLVSIVYCFLGEGDVGRRVAVGVLAGAWSFRLGTYVLYRCLRLPEDGRYVQLKEAAGDGAQRLLFGFYQLQAFGVVLFSTPMLMAANNTAAWNGLDIAAIAIWILAWGGESVADAQLAAFRRDPSTKGQVCRNGLWNYSRHPNYFFEWIHWWAYVAFAWQIPWGGVGGWIALIGPVAMYYFINFKTGIPPTEKQALLSRGDAYREYQQTTSAFFPWLPRAQARRT